MLFFKQGFGRKTPPMYCVTSSWEEFCYYSSEDVEIFWKHMTGVVPLYSYMYMLVMITLWTLNENIYFFRGVHNGCYWQQYYNPCAVHSTKKQQGVLKAAEFSHLQIIWLSKLISGAKAELQEPPKCWLHISKSRDLLLTLSIMAEKSSRSTCPAVRTQLLG